MELLIASALFIVVLGIMLGAVLFFFRVEVIREQQSDRQKIIRTWTQIFNNDFQSVIQDSEYADKAEGKETIRHFGVVGSQTQLQIDISDYRQLPTQISALRTIFYEFREGEGLFRWEKDFAAPEAVDNESKGTLTQFAPKMLYGQFRYFDGNTWHDQWMSLENQKIPAAIEVIFDLFLHTERERHRVVVEIPSASRSFSVPYTREIPPQKPKEANLEPLPASPPPSLLPPVISAPPAPETPSPFHSLFGDE